MGNDGRRVRGEYDQTILNDILKEIIINCSI